MCANYQQQQVRQNLQRVDEQLEALVEMSGTMRVVSASIQTELRDQNTMLADVDIHMDKTADNVDRANLALEEVKASSGTCAAWILMILLIAAIVCVWVIPFGEE